MPLALWTLLWLNFRAVVRRIGRQLRTPRGIIFFIIGIGVIGLWIARSIFLNHHLSRFNAQRTLAVAPIGLLAFCLANLFTSAGERAVTFTPAEVDFLFPGPFSRRSLLLYKLVKTGLGTVASALIFASILGRYGGLFIFRFGGIWLMFQFMQLLAMALAMVQTTLGERLFAAGRRWIILALLAAAALGLGEIYRSHQTINLSSLNQLQETKAGKIVLAPFVVFAHVLVAEHFTTQFLPWALAASAIDLAMALLVINLDANYLETSANVSARRYARVSRIRQSGLSGMAKPNSASWKIPMFPTLAGVGPLAWRQLTTAMRTARTMLITLCIGAAVAGIALSHTAEKDSYTGLMVGLAVYFNLFLSQMMKFDFRGDLDHIDLLRSLPLHPNAIAAAQLVAPTIVLSVVELLLVGSIAFTHEIAPLYLGLALLFVIPLNLLTIATDNLIFLLFPFRQTIAVAGDMGMVGRKTIIVACRTLLLLLIITLSAGVGAIAWFLTNKSLPIAAVAAWIPLLLFIALIIWLIGLTFKKFDPSVSTPA